MDLFKIAFERFNEYLLEYPQEEICVIWHGGEPCMAGLDLYKTALQHLKDICSETRERIRFAVQSNITRLPRISLMSSRKWESIQ